MIVEDQEAEMLDAVTRIHHTASAAAHDGPSRRARHRGDLQRDAALAGRSRSNRWVPGWPAAAKLQLSPAVAARSWRNANACRRWRPRD